MSGWINAEKQNPPPSKTGTRYLVIRKSGATAQHGKKWGGMGKPELAMWCSDWPNGWSTRGTLLVAYWMPLPKFDMVWNPRNPGEQGQWEPKARGEDE